jgi:methyl-accepting chemotaxis protein
MPVSVGIVLAVGLVAALAALVLRERAQAARLDQLGAVLRAIIAGEVPGPVPHQGRADAVGRLATAVAGARDCFSRDKQLTDQDLADLEARNNRQGAIERLTKDFNVTVGGVLDMVASAASDMRVTAQSMVATVGETGRQAAQVSEAAGRASANVDSVSAAAEELSASAAEIRRQVVKSSDVAQAAVAEAGRANDIVIGLATAAQKIGAVVNLINDIAAQTNLLALNATIEAARAGDAGKGFAVVAGEVKSLANQTAKATEEIIAQITAVQGATDEAVEAIDAVGKTIRDIHDASAVIVAAIDQQGNATTDIARSVSLAAAEARQVTQGLGSVNDATSATGSAAEDVLGAAGALSSQASELSTEVANFLSAIRDAANRRRFERVPCDLAASVELNGRRHDCRLKDISLGGALLDRALDARPGTPFTITVGPAASIHGRVVSHADGLTRLQFLLDAATQAKVAPLLKEAA